MKPLVGKRIEPRSVAGRRIQLFRTVLPEHQAVGYAFIQHQDHRCRGNSVLALSLMVYGMFQDNSRQHSCGECIFSSSELESRPVWRSIERILVCISVAIERYANTIPDLHSVITATVHPCGVQTSVEPF